MSPPSERELGAAVDQLSEIQFQVLAERFARLRDPERFDRLAPVGRTERMKAASTWGDGHVTFSDGRVDIVEATTTTRPRTHLKHDLKSAGVHHAGRLHGFLFVSSARPPSSDFRAEIVDELVSLGASRDRVELVFRDLLLRELAEPRFATLWPGLGCAVTPAPFTLIADAEIFGKPENSDRYVPSREDFDRESLPWLDIHTMLSDQLMEGGFAIVRGMRGSGKTVLAAQLGFRWSGLDLPCFYLDLGAQGKWSNHELLATLTWRADAGVLFIVDNVQYDEQLAAEIYRFWRARDDRSSLLLLGRTQGEREQGVARPLDGLTEFVTNLEPSTETINSVLEQELSRKGFPRVPANSATLGDWAEKFGGDLVALIAAIRKRLEAIAQGDLSLRVTDAVDYVRVRYLHESDSEINRELTMLAVAGQIEIRLPSEMLSHAAIAHASERGLLEPDSDERPGHLRYALPHPALAALLLAAHPAEETKVLSGIAVRSPLMLTEIVGRLRRQGLPAKAALVARHAVDALNVGLVSNLSLGQLAVFIAQTEKLTAVPRADLDRTLSRDPGPLAEAVTRGTPGGLTALLEEARERLPLTVGAIHESCARPETAARYADLAARAGSAVTHKHLATAKRRKLAVMVAAQLAALADQATARAFVDRALATGADAVADALSVSTLGADQVGQELLAVIDGEDGPARLASALAARGLQEATQLARACRGADALAEGLSKALLDERCQIELDRLLLESDLHDVGTFLHELKLQPLRERCVATVTDPANRAAIEMAAEASPIGDLPRFLDQIRGISPVLHAAIGASLADSATVEEACIAMLKRPWGLVGLRPFLLYAQRYIPDVFDAFLANLGAADFALPLAEAIARLEKLNEVTSLFDTLYELLPDAASRVARIAVSSPHVELLVYTVARSNNATSLAFTRSFELAGEVWDEMPAGLWADSCRRPGRGAMRAAELGALLDEIGHRELEVELATATAEMTAARDELGFSLTFADVAWILDRWRPDPRLLDVFAEKGLHEAWLIKRLRREPAGRIAELARASWALDDRLAKRLLDLPALRSRVERELSDGNADLGAPLALAGVLALGNHLSSVMQRIVHRPELSDLLDRYFQPPFKLDSQRAFLFLALAELAAAHRLQLEMPPGSQQYLLHLCREASDATEGRRDFYGLIGERLTEATRPNRDRY